MKLYVFRHGIAEDVGPDGTDASRRLTRDGIDKTRKAAEGIARLGAKPDVILTSPKLRAAQTAELAGDALDAPVETLRSLANSSPSAIIRDLTPRTEGEVMVVGHEPMLSRFIELICTGGSDAGFVELKKAGCACVDADIKPSGLAEVATLNWLLPAKTLRKLG